MAMLDRHLRKILEKFLLSHLQEFAEVPPQTREEKTSA
jgi:hypothetical protein